jgi:hypothetical protein
LLSFSFINVTAPALLWASTFLFLALAPEHFISCKKSHVSTLDDDYHDNVKIETFEGSMGGGPFQRGKERPGARHQLYDHLVGARATQAAKASREPLPF